MKVSADRGCFVCGSENRVGLHVSYEVDQRHNRSEAIITLADDYQGWQGVVHGGIISALLDEAAIYACRPLAMHAVTAELNIRYLKPVATNLEITINAEVQSIRRRLATVKSGLWQNGELMAEASVKVLFTDSKEG